MPINKKKKADAVEVKPKPKHCPKCVLYYNGMRMTNFDGKLYFFSQPGLRLLRFSDGPIYERIGVVTPCDCPTAYDVNEEYKESTNQRLKNYLSEENYRLYKENQDREISIDDIKVFFNRED